MAVVVRNLSLWEEYFGRMLMWRESLIGEGQNLCSEISIAACESPEYASLICTDQTLCILLSMASWGVLESWSTTVTCALLAVLEANIWASGVLQRVLGYSAYIAAISAVSGHFSLPGSWICRQNYVICRSVTKLNRLTTLRSTAI